MKMIKDNRSIDEILEKGLDCEAEITVSEVVDLLLEIAKNTKDAELYQCFEQDKDVEGFVISFVISMIATITEAFKDRDLKPGKA